MIHAVATEGKGISDALTSVRSFLAQGQSKDRAIANWDLRLREMLRERLLAKFVHLNFRAAAEEVAARRCDPYTVIDGWLEHFQD